ncbi:MAG: type VI secretion system membrane subunit TssM [Planctomycetes bacterium]|nr:type VI secretion system membrane subunit TssM [Planctomycetota bacterium]
MVQKILAVLTRPPVPFVLGLLVALAVFWFGGHLLRSAYGWPSDAVILGLCVTTLVLAVGFVVLRRVVARRKAKAIENEIRNQGRVQAASLPPAGRDEVDSLQQRFDEALASLKSSKLGRGALYAMPWFVVIGPPGSGKTTAITESGLNFPTVKGPNQKRGIRGVGGTRNCDWWFTDQAILLDTAGRYTTQAEDHDEWLTFLGMLKKARKQKPINGAIVAISIADVLGADEDALERHATTIRQRIDELVKQLEVVFPVYLMLTKCDLLSGFVEFFGSMAKEERAQVWGMTFPHGAAAEQDARFAAEFDRLCQRVELERMRLLVPDRPAPLQQKIFSLPMQLRSAKRKLTEFVRLLTQPNPYSDASVLRGVYLTSGTQEGAPIDLVMARMSSALGVETRVEGKGREAVEQKSYFLRDLFTKVVYADRDLAHSSTRVQKQQALVRKAVIVGSAVVSVGVAVQSLLSWSNTRGALAAFEEAARQDLAIVADRSDAPSAEAQKGLKVLHDRLMAMWGAYHATPLLGPSREVLVKAMGVYAEGVRSAFLAPANRHLGRRLQAYLDGKAPDITFDAASRMVLVYGAMFREFAPPAALRDAIESLRLWRWAPSTLEQPLQTFANSEEAQHLEAFLMLRDFDRGSWLVDADAALLQAAKDRLRSGSELQNVAAAIIAGNPGLLKVPEEDLGKVGRPEIDKRAGGDAAITDADLQALLSAERKRKLIEAMASIRLGDTSTLPKLIEALTDLDADGSPTMQAFVVNLEGLRQARVLPGPGFGADTVRTTYAMALKEIAGLRPSIGELVQPGSAADGYVLPDLLRGNLQWFEGFEKKLAAARGAVELKLRELDKELGGVGTATESSVVGPIAFSLRSMLDSVVGALAREARAEMLRHWRNAVGGNLDTYAERFPAKSDSENDTTVADFTALFRTGGKIDTEMSLLRQLREIKVLAGTLELHDGFKDFGRKVQAIREACFDAADQAKPRLEFRVVDFNSPEFVTELVLLIAQGNPVSNQEGTKAGLRNKPRRWEIGQTGAQLQLNTTKMGKLMVPAKSPSPSGWGLLRVVLAGRIEKVSNDARVIWTIDYDLPDETKGKAVCWWQFATDGQHNPFSKDFFEIKPPDRIFRDAP